MKHTHLCDRIYAAVGCLGSYRRFSPSTASRHARTYAIPEITVAEGYQTREVRVMASTQLLRPKGADNDCTSAVGRCETFCRSDGERLRRYRRTENRFIAQLRSRAYRRGIRRHHRQRLPDGANRHRTFLTGQCRPPVTQQRTKRQHLSARKVFRFRRDTEHTNTDTAIQEGKRTNVRAAFKTGSWGLVNPSLLLEQQLAPKWALSANGEWMSSDGRYPFTLHYGQAEGDLSSKETEETRK